MRGFVSHKYLETGDLSEAEIIEGLRLRTIGNEIVPMAGWIDHWIR